MEPTPIRSTGTRPGGSTERMQEQALLELQAMRAALVRRIVGQIDPRMPHLPPA